MGHKSRLLTETAALYYWEKDDVYLTIAFPSRDDRSRVLEIERMERFDGIGLEINTLLDQILEKGQFDDYHCRGTIHPTGSLVMGGGVILGQDWTPAAQWDNPGSANSLCENNLVAVNFQEYIEQHRNAIVSDRPHYKVHVDFGRGRNIERYRTDKATLTLTDLAGTLENIDTRYQANLAEITATGEGEMSDF